MDGAGVIKALGDGVTEYKIGDRVYFGGSVTGTYAAATIAKVSSVYLLPHNVSFSQGASLFIPYATAYRALFTKANAKPGETVFVHGASGGVGIAAVQLARAHGLTVIGTAGTEKGEELVIKEGAHHVLNHRTEGYIEAIKDLTNGKGPDIILEMLANVNLAKDLGVIAYLGRIVVIGSRGNVEIAPRDIMHKEAVVTGVALLTALPGELRESAAALHAGLTNGSLRPVVGEELKLAEAATAHERVINSTHYGNIVLLP